MSWLAKVRRYTPGTRKPESVLSKHESKEDAQRVADDWNIGYQTDTAYVEEYDPEKVKGFSLPRSTIEDLVAEIRRQR